MMRSSGARIDWANKAKGIAVGTAKLVEVESNFPCIPKAASALRLGPSFLDVRLGSVNALAGSTDSQLHPLAIELRLHKFLKRGHITIRLARTWNYIRCALHRAVQPSGVLSPFSFWRDRIINTSGYNSRKEEVLMAI
jgi:hypothetical protein